MADVPLGFTYLGVLTAHELAARAGEVLVGGLLSGMSSVDAGSIDEFWAKESFVRQTETGERESHPGAP